ncbi:MAG: hypothetical protein H6733_07100 [Alphaproteobacteria bacterium]|nr:hypothetical protein [Alphaproteobacteria bacterium]
MHRTPPLLLALALAGCQADVPTLTFGTAASHERAAFLSVGGTGPDDVWLVGAQPSATEGPVALHVTPEGTTAVATGQLHDLWWVQAFEGGPTFLAGGGATVLRVDGDTVTRTPTPHFFGNTVYGLWGSAPDDVWAVGGFAGRAGFVWHYDGAAWTGAELPDDLPRSSTGEIPSLFKVWGRSADDVWVVGGLGTVLHYDGTAWTLVPSGTDAQLFTVSGTDDAVVAVGGDATGVLIRGGLDGFTTDTPPGAPLLQGLTVDADGVVWVAGADGFAAAQAPGGDWQAVDLGLTDAPQSIHALWSDGEGQVWAVGGNVLTPTLDAGVAVSSAPPDPWGPDPVVPGSVTCPTDPTDWYADKSIARRWMEQLLDAVRRDIPNPPVHARNLLHTSMAMYDAWTVYDDVADGVLNTQRLTGDDTDRQTAISYAAYRVLTHRYANAVGGANSLDCFAGFMDALGLDPDDTHTDGDDAVAVGNRIGAAVIDTFADDGANEANGYTDTTSWAATNPVMVVDRVGTNVTDPDTWQQLNLGTAETQNGIVLDTSVQPYIGAHWRGVTAFAVPVDGTTGLHGDPGDGYPSVNDPEMVDWVVEIIRKTAELDIDDGVMMDTSPASVGNNPLGTNDGQGYATNPVTGGTYTPRRVPRGDFTRVVAELWADGPKSETPPGHWADLASDISDRIDPDDLRPYGQGEPVDRLAWDVGIYLAVTAATHDAAIVAWELKRDGLGPRPITLVRWMAQNGQRSDASAPNYSPDGLPLVPGLIEQITAASSAPGERHHDLRWYEGEIAIRSWPGEPGDRLHDHTPLQWMRAVDWIPYQRRTFVTPAFPGFISGHSTFSRAAAEAMTAYTGSPWFPGGLHEYVLPKDNYLVFENGPSADVHLQWASYYDAADQAGQSRLWGGIHIWPDDRVGRINGSHVGMVTSARTQALWDGTER